MIDHELSIGLQHLAVPIMHVPSINLATIRTHSIFFLNQVNVIKIMTNFTIYLTLTKNSHRC